MESEQKTILIVEDEESMVQILADRFELEGYKILVARDGEEGLATALSSRPDLILLDIILPKMNGAEMLTKLLQDAWGKTVPVVCLTNLEDTPESIRKHMKEHKSVSYIVKVHMRLDGIISHVQQLLTQQ